MIAFLFGAGASYGSGEVDPCPPPLGKDLYKALKRLYPTSWGTFDKALQYTFDENFEYGMAELIEKNSHVIAPLMQQMAIFFSRFGLNPNSDNLYIKLIEKLKERNIVNITLLSTLNYECLCEIAGSAVGFKIDYFGEPNNESVNVWKIHGSCNFKLAGLDATRGISFSHGISFGGGIEYLNPGQVAGVYKGNTALYPSMCLYAKDKPISIAPEVIKKFQSEWSDKIENADKIICIGVRPLAEDLHIWDPIAKSNGDLFFVGDQTDFESWIDEFRSGKENKYLGNYWSTIEQEIYNEL